jgi:hypothetical protein
VLGSNRHRERHSLLDWEVSQAQMRLFEELVVVVAVLVE